MAIKNGLKQGLVLSSAKICNRIFIDFIWYSINILQVTILFEDFMIESKFVCLCTSEILL